MNFVSEGINKYCLDHSKPQEAILAGLERETHLKMTSPQMLSGHLQGKFLSLFSAMLKPKAILELGTFTGYSAICLASGLADGGMLDTIEANEELEEIIMKYLRKAGLDKKVNLHIGKAEEIVPKLNRVYDLVFIDAEKTAYQAYYQLVFGKVNTGGFIIADNALWDGKVLNEKRDAETEGISRFNKLVQNDSRVDNMLLPLRDGVMVIRKLV